MRPKRVRRAMPTLRTNLFSSSTIRNLLGFGRGFCSGFDRACGSSRLRWKKKMPRRRVENSEIAESRYEPSLLPSWQAFSMQREVRRGRKVDRTLTAAGFFCIFGDTRMSEEQREMQNRFDTYSYWFLLSLG